MGAVATEGALVSATEDEGALAAEGIEVLRGRARLTGDRRLDVEGRSLRGRRIILATGARPLVPPVPGLADRPHLTNETVFQLEQRPRRLAVLDGGAIGVELTQAFRALGSEVAVIEGAQRLLPREEPEASAVIERCSRRRGIDVRTGLQLGSVGAAHGGGSRLRLADGTDVVAAQLLVATGRRPTTDDLGLAEAGVEVDERGHIATGRVAATTAKGIWAIGDVTGRMPFTHAAGCMAFVAVGDALSRVPLRRPELDPTPIPWVTFTTPEVARIGMTEHGSAAAGGRVAHLPLSELDRGIITGETDGFVKLIAGLRRLLGNAGGGTILGATVVGPAAGELIGLARPPRRTRRGPWPCRRRLRSSS